MSNFSILDNLLTPERAEKLTATVVNSLVNDLQEHEMSDDEYAQILDKAINANPGVKAVLSVSEDAMVELAARVVVELHWQTACNPSSKTDAMCGLAIYLAEWLAEKAAEDDEDDDEIVDDDDDLSMERYKGE